MPSFSSTFSIHGLYFTLTPHAKFRELLQFWCVCPAIAVFLFQFHCSSEMWLALIVLIFIIYLLACLRFCFFVQDYIDSMEGATLSGRQASAYICDAGEGLVALRKELDAEFKDDLKFTNTKDKLSLVWEISLWGSQSRRKASLFFSHATF